ncbi:hypothetical protein KA977_09565, partial [Candidatus Dependentiae bacterium]|nr:hypothetical protein [Candidatus Dependentiae bacterium]
AISAGQILSLIFAVYSIYLFSLIMRILIKDIFFIICSVFYFTFSYWFWYYSMDAELHIPNIFFMLLSINLYIKLYREPSVKYVIYSAVINSFLIIFHQTNLIIFSITLLFNLEYFSDKKKVLVIWVISFLMITIIPYIIIPHYFLGISSTSDLIEWLTRYQSKGYWSNITQNYLIDSMKGFSFALTGGGKIKLITNSVLALLVLVYYFKKIFLKKIDRIELYIFCIFIFYSGIVIYWHPANPENWWAVMPFSILLFKAAESLKNTPVLFRGFDFTQKNISSLRILLLSFFSIFSIFLFKLFLNKIIKLFFIIWLLYSFNAVFNGYIVKYHKKESNQCFNIIHNLNKIYNQGDLIISLGEGDLANLNVYLKYFTKYNFTTIAIELDLYSGSLEKTIESIACKINQTHGKIILINDLYDVNGISQLSKMHKLNNLKNSLHEFIYKINKNKVIINL